MIVVKHPMNAEAPGLLCYPSDFPDTFDAQFIAALIRRGNKNLNSNVSTHWRTLCAKNQGAIQCNVVREASFRALHTVIPMENDRESKLVSNRSSTLQTGLFNQEEMHT